MSDTPPQVDDDTTKLDAFEKGNAAIRMLDDVRANPNLSAEVKAQMEASLNDEIAKWRGISGPQHVTGRMG